MDKKEPIMYVTPAQERICEGGGGNRIAVLLPCADDLDIG